MNLKIKVKNHIRPLLFTETVTDVFIHSVRLGSEHASDIDSYTLICSAAGGRTEHGGIQETHVPGS